MNHTIETTMTISGQHFAALQAVVEAAREAEEALQDNNSTYAIALLQIALAAHDQQEKGT